VENQPEKMQGANGEACTTSSKEEGQKIKIMHRQLKERRDSFAAVILRSFHAHTHTQI